MVLKAFITSVQSDFERMEGQITFVYSPERVSGWSTLDFGKISGKVSHHKWWKCELGSSNMIHKCYHPTQEFINMKPEG